MNERNEEGLTIGEFFKMVWSQKILALIVMVAITLVGTLGIYFGYNAMTATYSVTYRMTFPNTDTFLNEYRYPDGSVFYYTSLTSDETLDAVKAKSSRFSDINNRSISIVYNYVEATSSTTTTTTTTTSADKTFTLSASTRAFESAEVARDFFVELANYPTRYFAEINYDYHSSLISYTTAKADSVTNYGGLLSILSNQLSTINNHYSNLVDTYGGSFALLNEDNNVTNLAAYQSVVAAYVRSTELEINNMRLQVNQEGIKKSGLYVENLERQRAAVKSDLDNAQATLDLLIKYQTTTDGSAAVLKAQQDLVNSLTIQYNDLDRLINSGSIDTGYMTNLDTIFTQIDKFATDLEYITKQVNTNVASVTFVTNGIIEVEEVGALLSTAISLLVGVIVAIIVGYCVAANKIKKAMKSAAVAAEAAPVTDDQPPKLEE